MTEMDSNSTVDVMNECLELYFVQVVYLDLNNDFDVANERLKSYYVQLV